MFIIRKACRDFWELRCYSDMLIRFLSHFIWKGCNANTATHNDHDYMNYSHGSYFKNNFFEEISQVLSMECNLWLLVASLVGTRLCH